MIVSFAERYRTALGYRVAHESWSTAMTANAVDRARIAEHIKEEVGARRSGLLS